MFSNNVFSSNQLDYLTMKYYEMFEELSLHELVVNLIKILQQYWPSSRLSNEIEYDGNEYKFSYVMKVSCSVKNLFFKKAKTLSIRNR